MYLINKNDVGYCDWWQSYLWFELIGFWPCSDKERYYSCRGAKGNIVPVFLGNSIDLNPDSPYYNTMWKFDTENYNKREIVDEWVLFFLGCDDGHCGMRFPTRESALEFLDNCDVVDFADFLHRYCNDKQCPYKLEFHN